MGRNVFTHVSEALAPLRNALAETFSRRSVDLQQLRPEAHEALKGVAIRELMDSVPSPLFKPTSTMREVGRAFAEHNHELFYICGEGQTLEGVVTMTDWMRALSRGAGPDTPVAELMVRQPITLSIEDDGVAAATIVREHRVKHLPVVSCRGNRQLVGSLRTRRLMAHVFSKVGTSASRQADHATPHGVAQAYQPAGSGDFPVASLPTARNRGQECPMKFGKHGHRSFPSPKCGPAIEKCGSPSLFHGVSPA